MKKVTGIGGVFFKCKDADAMRDWYQKHLNINAGQHGAQFHWRESDSNKEASTTWSLFAEDTTYFSPSDKSFMINYRVDDLVALIAELRKEGVEIVGDIQTYDFGKFAWVIDPEGNKVELWEPV